MPLHRHRSPWWARARPPSRPPSRAMTATSEAEDSYTLTVDNAAIAYTAEGWHGAYDAQAHGITVKVTTVLETLAQR